LACGTRLSTKREKREVKILKPLTQGGAALALGYFRVVLMRTVCAADPAISSLLVDREPDSLSA
jgi:hypothetical protein